MKEQTLAILKPDCVQKNQIGKVIDHLLNAGFKIVAMKMVHLTRESAGEFYAVHKERLFYPNLLGFMTESEVVPMVLEKENAVAELRKTIGATDPAEAADGTVRKLYAESKQNNVIHASDSLENAQIEVSFFFSKKEIIDNKS
ncbi:MAG: nucleoside-diphosphate kinase [Calditrichales bacterium]|nr:MAG: nucleoside-diphosphate kinase [Calditrichales bacterium]